MIIDLIRHTTPDIADGICYGRTDLDVKSSFEAESRAIRERVFSEYDAIISSPLQRCKKLANTLTAPMLNQDSRIMEYDFGDWELKPWSEFKSQQAEEWMNNFVDQPAPNGESMAIMQSRVMSFWSDLLSKDHQKVAVVTHSGVQRLIHAHIFNTPLTHMFRLELEFGAVLRIKHKRETGLTTVKHLA